MAEARALGLDAPPPQRAIIAGVEQFLRLQNPEVEIARRFDDPGWRLRAMNDFADMVMWLNQRGGGLTMCSIEDGMIVWRFRCNSAEEFNAAFDRPDTPPPSPR